MIALLMKRIILHAQLQIGEDRSIFGLYHILQGRASIQTIQDIKLYRLSDIYGIYRKLDRGRFVAFMEALHKQGYLFKKQSDFFIPSAKGREWLEHQGQAEKQLYLNGQQYGQQDRDFFHRLQLLVQVWTNMKKGNRQFIPIVEDRKITNWVKQFYQRTKTKIDIYLFHLHEELYKLLLELPEHYPEIFLAQLSSCHQIGKTIEQLSHTYGVSKEDIYLVTTNTLHYILHEVKLNAPNYPVLHTIMEQLQPEENLTQSAKVSARYLMQGYAGDEIAASRGLKANTIYDHIVELMMQKHSSVIVEDYLTTEEMTEIEKAIFESQSYKLKSIKENLREDITYFQIRLVLAMMK